MVKDLFAMFLSNPNLLPDAWRADIARAEGDTELARLVTDYIAGMTDRFALTEHARLKDA